LKKSLSSWWNILNCSTNASLYSPGFFVILVSIASVATKSSGPALRWSLFCIVCLISCWIWTKKRRKKEINTSYLITAKITYQVLCDVSYNLKVMRNVAPMSNISNPSKRNRCCEFCLEWWQTGMDFSNNKHFLNIKFKTCN